MRAVRVAATWPRCAPERVVARDVDGKLLVRWMLQRRGNVVHLTNDAGVQLLASGCPVDAVVGFPVEDIYVFPATNPLQRRFEE